jgi:hypothetical protein
MDYLIILAVVLVIALVVIGLSIDLPGIAQSLQNKGQLDFWHNQARPFVITDAFYRVNNSRFYLEVEVREDDTFNLTGLFINNTQVAFYEYDATAAEGVGSILCDASTCQTSPCICNQNVRPHTPISIVSETVDWTPSVCALGAQQTPLALSLVYFRLADNVRNLTELGPVPLPFSCQ